MIAFVVQQEDEAVEIPRWVRTLASFRRWAKSDEYPRRGQFAWLGGAIWIDSSMERERHNQIKTEVTSVLALLAKRLNLGRLYGDGMGLANTDADLGTEPDAMFLSHDSMRDGRVSLERREDSLEIVGSPDMVLEVVSPTSVQKDTVVLRDLYWRAGVREYWLINPLRNNLTFDLLRHGPAGFVAARKQKGWVRSPVFGRSFRLSRGADPSGLETYTLDVR